MGPNHPLHSLVMRCLENRPEERPSARDLIEVLDRFKYEDVQTDSASLRTSLQNSKFCLFSSPRFDGDFNKPSESPPSFMSMKRHVMK